MTIMRPPQRGQGPGSTRGSSGAAALLLLGLDDVRRSAEQRAGAGDVSGAIAVGEQPVLADAVEALGQHGQVARDSSMRVTTGRIGGMSI
jgi:hypothetical protein